MKRIGHIFDKITDPENIRTAIRKSSLGKRDKWYVQNVLAREDDAIEAIRAMLIDRAFTPASYLSVPT